MLGPKTCDCYHCAGKPADAKGKQPCEYYDHHCDLCHERGICTAHACRDAMSAKREEQRQQAAAEGDATKLGKLPAGKAVGKRADRRNDGR